MPHARRFARRCLYILILFAGVGLLGLVITWILVHQPAAIEAGEQIIQVTRGAGLRQIAGRLHEAGLIRHPLPFILYAKARRMAPRLQAGEYALRASMSPAEILDLLYRGRIMHHALTIPEGATLRDISALVAAKDMGSEQRVLELASDAAFIESLGLTVSSLEGYLFPDTYHVTRGMDEAALLTFMVRTFGQNYPAQIAAKAEALGLSQHDVVTLASLIEKEAQLDSERELIAAVFHNRLRRRMRLQCDSTVIYALGEAFKGNLTKADLQIDSPYNTYRYAGLPPGPIANPGRRSIAAAVTPAAVKYLYFVATRENGAHHFSNTLKEHNRAVRKYQLNR